jgi:hypothetical protein
VKKNFSGASDITTEYLVAELYGGLEESENGQFANEISLYEKVGFDFSFLFGVTTDHDRPNLPQILNKAAEQNWEQERLVEFLTQRSLPADHVQVFSNLWAKESAKVLNLSLLFVCVEVDHLLNGFYSASSLTNRLTSS